MRFLPLIFSILRLVSPKNMHSLRISIICKSALLTIRFWIDFIELNKLRHNNTVIMNYYELVVYSNQYT